MNDVVVALRPIDNSPRTQAINHLCAVSDGIAGLQELARSDDREIQAMAIRLANEAEELTALARQAAGIDLAASRADDAVDMLTYSANEVRAIFERSPAAVANRLQEINQASYTISGVINVLGMWRRLALHFRAGRV